MKTSNTDKVLLKNPNTTARIAVMGSASIKHHSLLAAQSVAQSHQALILMPKNEIVVKEFLGKELEPWPWEAYAFTEEELKIVTSSTKFQFWNLKRNLKLLWKSMLNIKKLG